MHVSNNSEMKENHSYIQVDVLSSDRSKDKSRQSYIECENFY